MKGKISFQFHEESDVDARSFLQALRRGFDVERFARTPQGDWEVVAIPRAIGIDESGLTLESTERALRAREQMLAIVSHDLRNPLGAIQLNVETIQKKILTASSLEEVRQTLPYLKSILRSYLRMKSLVSDVLDKVRLESGHFKIRRARRGLNEFLVEVADVFSPLAQERYVHFNMIAPDKRIETEMDFERVYQILSNLLGNAVKFTPPNGTITVRAILRADHIEFQVKDTGPGIPKEHLDNIFEKYWQMQASPRLGVGLGLAIVKDLVKAHGGRIWVESEPGHGTHFGFQIPCEWWEMSENPSRSAVEAKKKICLIDDDDDLRDILRENLADLGYGVETYPNGFSALQGLKRPAGLPDLLLVDFRLPDMSGGELVDRLETQLSDRHIPVVFLSAENNLSSLAAEHKASAYLSKPLRLQDLTHVIESFTTH